MKVVNMTVNLVASMLGYFEFRLCAYKKTAKQLVTQGCFDRHLLESDDGSGQTRFPIGENQNNTLQTVSLSYPMAMFTASIASFNGATEQVNIIQHLQQMLRLHLY